MPLAWRIVRIQQYLSLCEFGGSICKSEAMVLRVHKRAAEIGREQIENHHQKVKTAALSEALVLQRAALVLYVIAGFQVMRHDWPNGPGKAEPKALVKILGPVFQQLVRGEAPRGYKMPNKTLHHRRFPARRRLFMPMPAEVVQRREANSRR